MINVLLSIGTDCLACSKSFFARSSSWSAYSLVPAWWLPLIWMICMSGRNPTRRLAAPLFANSWQIDPKRMFMNCCGDTSNGVVIYRLLHTQPMAASSNWIRTRQPLSVLPVIVLSGLGCTHYPVSSLRLGHTSCGRRVRNYYEGWSQRQLFALRLTP